MSNCTQDSHKVCTKLLSLPENSIFSPSANIKICTLWVCFFASVMQPAHPCQQKTLCLLYQVVNEHLNFPISCTHCTWNLCRSLRNTSTLAFERPLTHTNTHKSWHNFPYIMEQLTFICTKLTVIAFQTSGADLEFWKGGFQYAIWARVGCLLGGGWGYAPPGKFLPLWDRFWCILGVKLQKLDDLLLNRVVVFEARRIKGVAPLRTAEAAKQPVIRVKRGKISVLILIAYRHP